RFLDRRFLATARAASPYSARQPHRARRAMSASRSPSRHYASTAVLILAAACTPARRRTPDDTLVVAIEAAMASYDPRYALSNWDGKLSKLVCPGLMSVDTATTEPRLELASKVTHADEL